MAADNDRKFQENKGRENWSNQCDFILSCLAYTVGFGNIWRFPYLCFKNGGAVFLIPYTIMLLCAGLPLYFMELAIGQYASCGPSILFSRLCPIASVSVALKAFMRPPKPSVEELLHHVHRYPFPILLHTLFNIGLGWAMLVLSMIGSIYYNIILAWTIFYAVDSFKSILPWSHCGNDFNTIRCATDIEAMNCSERKLVYYNHSCYDSEVLCNVFNLTASDATHCLKKTDEEVIYQKVEEVIGRISASEDYFKNRMLRVTGTTWENIGGMNWELVGCLALAWIMVFLAIMKGVKSSGKVVYFTALFPYVVLVILFVKGLMLDGSDIGIRYYLVEVKWETLTKAEVWNDAATQILFSLSSTFGALISMASYNRFNNNCMRDAIFIVMCNSCTSVFAGFCIFSVLGFMAKQLDVSVNDVATSGSGLAFIAYPQALTMMPLSTLWSILFFSMLITIGLDSQFTMVETISTSIFDKCEYLRPKKTLVVGILCLVLFLCGLPMCLEGGIYLFELFNAHVTGMPFIFIALAELVVIQYSYGFDRFMDNIRQGMGIYVPKPLYYYWKITWKFVTPISLMFIFGFSVYSFAPVRFGDYIFPRNVQNFGWILGSLSVSMLPIFAIIQTSRCILKRQDLRTLLQTTEDYFPAHERKVTQT